MCPSTTFKEGDQTGKETGRGDGAQTREGTNKGHNKPNRIQPKEGNGGKKPVTNWLETNGSMAEYVQGMGNVCW